MQAPGQIGPSQESVGSGAGRPTDPAVAAAAAGPRLQAQRGSLHTDLAPAARETARPFPCLIPAAAQESARPCPAARETARPFPCLIPAAAQETARPCPAAASAAQRIARPWEAALGAPAAGSPAAALRADTLQSTPGLPAPEIEGMAFQVGHPLQDGDTL